MKSFPMRHNKLYGKKISTVRGSNGRGTLTEQPVWDGEILTHYMLAGQKFSSDS